MSAPVSFRFHPGFLLPATALFVVEVVIATVLADVTVVRGYLGDVLVMPLLYAMTRTVVAVQRPAWLIVGLFGLAVTVEVLQLLGAAARLGLRPGSLPAVLLGTTFSWADLACYAAGCGLIALAVLVRRGRRPRPAGEVSGPRCR